jgi:hypothetical protein
MVPAMVKDSLAGKLIGHIGRYSFPLLVFILVTSKTKGPLQNTLHHPVRC